jgi:hypothetical protein
VTLIVHVAIIADYMDGEGWEIGWHFLWQLCTSLIGWPYSLKCYILFYSILLGFCVSQIEPMRQCVWQRTLRPCRTAPCISSTTGSTASLEIVAIGAQILKQCSYIFSSTTRVFKVTKHHKIIFVTISRKPAHTNNTQYDHSTPHHVDIKQKKRRHHSRHHDVLVA